MKLLRNIFVILSIVVSVWTDNICPKAPYSDINLTQLNGTWYAIQGIEHGELRGHKRLTSTKICPVFNLLITKPNLIEFEFDKKNETTPRIYHLIANDTKTSSLWTPVGVHLKRSLFDLIQVTTLTNDAILLTMCSEKRKGSVVLSRKNTFDKNIVEKANITLTERKMINKGTFNRCVKN